MAKSITLSSINPQTFELQNYSATDNELITNFIVDPTFNPETDYISYYIYNLNGFLESYIYNSRYAIRNQELYVTPEQDVITQTLEIGEYNILYYFLQNQANSNPGQQYFISEISSDRTELRLDSTQISDALLLQGGADLILKQTNTPGVFLDFYLNFQLNMSKFNFFTSNIWKTLWNGYSYYDFGIFFNTSYKNYVKLYSALATTPPDAFRGVDMKVGDIVL